MQGVCCYQLAAPATLSAPRFDMHFVFGVIVAITKCVGRPLRIAVIAQRSGMRYYALVVYEWEQCDRLGACLDSRSSFISARVAATGSTVPIRARSTKIAVLTTALTAAVTIVACTRRAGTRLFQPTFVASGRKQAMCSAI